MQTGAVAIPVSRVAQQCFVRLVHATGYVLPRDVAVVMFNAPDFRLTDVLVKPGDTVRRGDVVAKAVSTASPPAGGTDGQVSVTSLASGLVLQVAAVVGMPTSRQGEPLATLAVDGDLEVTVDVPATRVFELAAGQVAHVGLRDGAVVEGHLRLAPLTIDPDKQMAQARIAFDGLERPAAGRFVWATIEASRSCGAGVPLSALRNTSEGPRVQVVESGVVVTRSVQLGLAGEHDVEVTHGLALGDIVVANAGTALQDGDRISPVFAEGQSPS